MLLDFLVGALRAAIQEDSASTPSNFAATPHQPTLRPIRYGNMRSDLDFSVEPIRTTKTFEAAIRNIVEGVERSGLTTGDRLPNETELAAQLGISRPTLRQALRVLQHAGLLQVRAGKGGGIFVTSEVIPAGAISRSVALEEEAAVDILRARRVLEGSITFVSMQFGTPQDFTAIERTVELLGENIGDRSAVMEVDAMFHRAVIRACHNQALQSAMGEVGALMAPIRDTYKGGRSDDQLTLDIHKRQLAAMREGRAQELARVIHEHFSILEEDFSEVIGREWDDLFGRLAAPLQDFGNA